MLKDLTDASLNPFAKNNPIWNDTCIFNSSSKSKTSYYLIVFFTGVAGLKLDEQMGDEGLDDQTTEV